MKFGQDGVQGHLLHFDADVLLVGIRWLGRPSHISRVREQGTEGLRDALAVFRPSDSGSDDDVQSFIDARQANPWGRHRFSDEASLLNPLGPQQGTSSSPRGVRR